MLKRFLKSSEFINGLASIVIRIIVTTFFIAVIDSLIYDLDRNPRILFTTIFVQLILYDLLMWYFGVQIYITIHGNIKIRIGSRRIRS